MASLIRPWSGFPYSGKMGSPRFKLFLSYLLLLLIVISAGIVSGVIVMEIALGHRAETTAPSIEGDEVVNALQKIARTGLNLKITSLEYDDDKPRNTVIRQFPKGGAVIKQGRDVSVVISRGPKVFDMPDLRGLSLRQATNLLQEKGISTAQVSRVHNILDEGKIVSQFPAAFTHVSDLSQVELLASLGKLPSVQLVPELMGLSLEQAKKEIIRAGFIPGKITHENRGEGIPGTVSSTTPPSNMPVEEGSEIAITLIQLAQRAGNPATYSLYRFTLPSNSGVAPVKIVQETKGGQKVIYEHSHNGGETLSIMVETGSTTTVRVYVSEKLMEIKQF